MNNYRCCNYASFHACAISPTGHPHGILYQADTAIAYRPVSASQLITRCYGTNHTPYQIGSTAISTTSSNSLQPLTHLPSSHSSPYQYLSPTTQHASTTFQPRHIPPAVPTYGQILPTSLQVATSPALTPGTTSSYLSGQPQQQQQQQQRPTTMNYNVGYSSTVSTSSFGTPHLHTPMVSPGSDQLPGQTAFSPAALDSARFGTTQISQHQTPHTQTHWNSPGFP